MSFPSFLEPSRCLWPLRALERSSAVFRHIRFASHSTLGPRSRRRRFVGFIPLPAQALGGEEMFIATRGIWTAPPGVDWGSMGARLCRTAVILSRFTGALDVSG